MHAAGVCVLSLFLAGCAAGPDFKSPSAPDVKNYTAKPLVDKTSSAGVQGGEAQRLVLGEKVPLAWWSLFRSEPLDQLIRTALKDSPTLVAAQARLRQAREEFNAQSGTVTFPSLDASLSGSRQKPLPVAGGLPEGKGHAFDLYNASVNVSYTFDMFGSGRRQLEALKARVDHETFQFEAAYLALSANVVTTAVREAALREELKATQEILASQEKQLKMVEDQFALGGVARADVLAQSAEVQATRAAVPSIEKELSRMRNQLTVLTGKFPEAAGSVAEFRLEDIHLPEEIPVSLPSELARKRPDIRAAEELVHAACAQLGTASADLYPKITLSGSYGPQASTFPNLLDAKNNAWNLGAGVMAPIFNGGSLRARKRAAAAGYDVALAQYRGIVLAAFQEVADVLGALEADAATLKAHAEALSVAKDSLDLTEKQFAAGAVNSSLLFNAQRRYHQARIAVVMAQAARFADTAALFQSLGGGWD
jgi:NodT family efflux transporter outer membrane factor (OMF) lipoprotein